VPGIGAIRAEAGGVLSLAVPIVAGLAASTLIGVTDSIMLAPLGPLPLAAAGLTGAVIVILLAGIFGLLAALSVRIGEAWGARQGRRIPSILRNGLVLGLAVGLSGVAVMAAVWPVLPHLGQPKEVVAALPGYWTWMALWLVPFSLMTVFKSAFEAIGRAWLGTGFAFLGVVLNVPLNYALIWGIGPFPQLGLTGAGVASFAAELMALGAVWVYWQAAPSMRRLRPRRSIDRAEIAAAFREGAPLGIMYIAETGATAVATFLVGLFGTVALAGNQVALSLESVFYMLPLGIAGAVAIRVAQAKGAGEVGRLGPIAYAALSVGLVWLIGAAVVLGAFGRRLSDMITDDAPVAETSAAILLVMAPMLIADALQSTMLGALRGLSDTAYPAAVSTVAYWIAALPLGWLLATWGGMGPPGIWAGFLLGLTGAGVMLLLRFRAQTRLLQANASLLSAT
jgi:MATE family multidrug resistance protein